MAADITDAAPSFLSDVAKEIFLCGKSFSLLRLCTAGQVCKPCCHLSAVFISVFMCTYPHYLARVCGRYVVWSTVACYRLALLDSSYSQ